MFFVCFYPFSSHFHLFRLTFNAGLFFLSCAFAIFDKNSNHDPSPILAHIQVIVDPRALVALLRSANVEERHGRRQQQLIKQALPQLQAHANALTNALKPLEFNGKPLPSSKMAIGPGSSYGNTYGRSGGAAALSSTSPAWLPQHMRLPPTTGASPAPSSSTSSPNYTPHHAPLRSSPAAAAAGPDGYDESAEVAQVLVLESAINTVRACALAYSGPRSISGAGLSPLNGQSYALKEFRQVVKHTLGLMLSPGQVSGRLHAYTILHASLLFLHYSF